MNENLPCARRLRTEAWLPGGLFAICLAGVFLAARLGKRCLGRTFLLTFAACLGVLPPPATAVQDSTWALQLSAGLYRGADDDWRDGLDSPVTFDAKAGFGYHFVPGWEIGIEAGYRNASGDEKTSVSGDEGTTSVVVDQEMTVIPAQLYVMYQWRHREAQILVPYGALGVGWYHYRQEVDGDDTTGGVWSYSGRAGLKLLLNPFDPRAAKRARRTLGLRYTYSLLEAQYARADDFGDNATDLGGWSFYGGFAFEL